MCVGDSTHGREPRKPQGINIGARVSESAPLSLRRGARSGADREAGGTLGAHCYQSPFFPLWGGKNWPEEGKHGHRVEICSVEGRELQGPAFKC